MLDSVIRVNKKYYPQTLLDECKYKIKKNKMENQNGKNGKNKMEIKDDLSLCSSDESDNESDNESNDEPDELMNLMVNLLKIKTVL